MARKKRHHKIKAILFLSMVFTWLLCLPIMAEEKALKNLSYSNERLEAQSIFNTSLIPLETESKITPELFKLVNIEIKGLKTRLNLTPKRINIKPDPSPHLNKHFKMQRLENSLYTGFLLTQTILNVADYVITVKGLKYESLQEGNPIMKPLVKNPYLLATVKFGTTALNFYFMKKLHKKNKTLAWIASTISTFVLSYFVVNNIKMIHKAQGV